MCILWHQTHRVNRVDFPLLWTFRCRVASRALWMCNIRQTEMKVVLYFVPVPVFIKTTYYWRQRRRRWRRLCCTSMYIIQASMSVWWRTFTFTLNIARHDIVPSIRNNNRKKNNLTCYEHMVNDTYSHDEQPRYVSLCVHKNQLTDFNLIARI